MGSFIDSYLQIINQKFGGIPKRLYKAATSLKRNKSIRITKADKGNSIVIIDHDQYITKARTLLEDSNVYMKLRSSLKHNTSTFKKNFVISCVKLPPIVLTPVFSRDLSQNITYFHPSLISTAS